MLDFSSHLKSEEIFDVHNKNIVWTIITLMNWYRILAAKSHKWVMLCSWLSKIFSGLLFNNLNQRNKQWNLRKLASVCEDRSYHTLIEFVDFFSNLSTIADKCYRDLLFVLHLYMLVWNDNRKLNGFIFLHWKLDRSSFMMSQSLRIILFALTSLIISNENVNLFVSYKFTPKCSELCWRCYTLINLL